ncbi:hypothetical protein [Streptomyces sp. NPDC018045]|uniref:hypothetical protein n=1 Tax=Streptomyces sp. NPDC018045 TaxID=3365037 RepID=UPI00379C14A5
MTKLLPPASAHLDDGVDEPLLVQQLIAEHMKTLDRTEPFCEVKFAALETALLLLRADCASEGRSCEYIDVLREALGSARATVVAAGCVLTKTMDRHRTHRCDC